ncbi:Uncharacterized protein, DUF1810 family [Granulicella rosea]|uniref:Uncharacterized protein, DUF1810 family n=1 Tax=Granulicella rosea TaxID=474952 RepID=A0A239LD75_9BACT|nr:DUF1810 domain-containing protein [Granulicella rosea]SNT28255.1 Uncharacterized protein, DUF1810 family [Granulicella rosea]
MTQENDSYRLQRFVEAQAGAYDQAVAELRKGRKQSHWMWFIFPQIKGLGSSVTAEHYAIGSLQEAEAYLEHQILGYRLRACAGVLLQHHGLTAEGIFGYPDYLKLHSSMTLFDQASPDERLFSDVLVKYFGGKLDEATLVKLKGH